VAELTVYEKPTCSKCRALAALLDERGIDFERSPSLALVISRTTS
jgi:arsenate reductase-like glutaredoxin family protein